MRAQLLALLLYSTAASLQRLASAFGGEEGEWGAGTAAGEEGSGDDLALLPGPHAPLRCLFALDPGRTPALSCGLHAC